MTPEAREQFQDLLAMLQQQMMQQTFQGMQQSLGQMTPEDMRRDAPDDAATSTRCSRPAQRGEDPNFEQFMHNWGHFFGPMSRTSTI